ncbi:MAG: trimeric intracellular cation channel family protein [Anaerolineales bacterium]|nr:trimeric intracellular cation channel family protein [Anaerolineales bacterium]MCB9113111.1 trimeric intracellular cation channel family protein [Anaerolineales bacterium]
MEQLLPIFTYIAVAASAISGALEARKHEMDIVGATTIAFVTAFGGGTMRDLLLGRTPVFWVIDPGLTVTTFVIAVFTFYRLQSFSNRLLIFADAIGLGIFSILGATYALQRDISPIVAILMGVITGIFGGVLRDVLSNRIPSVFGQSTELYATCSFVGTSVFVLINSIPAINTLPASLIGALTVFAMRLLAVRFKVTLPSP